MNNKWILADWHLFFAYAEKMLPVYPQPAWNLNISERQKDNQCGKICVVQWILSLQAQWDASGIFSVLFFCFLFIQDGKTTGWHPLQRSLAKPAGVNSLPVLANVPAGLCFKPSTKAKLLWVQTPQPTSKFIVYNLLPRKSVWVLCTAWHHANFQSQHTKAQGNVFFPIFFSSL